MVLIHVSFGRIPAAACKYCTVCPIEGKLYKLLACSVVEVSFIIVHNFAPFVLCPCSTGGSVVVMESVPGLWMVTPCFPG